MKKTITLILTILSFGFANAQAPAIQWQKCFGGSSIDGAKKIVFNSDVKISEPQGHTITEAKYIELLKNGT